MVTSGAKRTCIAYESGARLIRGTGINTAYIIMGTGEVFSSRKEVKAFLGVAMEQDGLEWELIYTNDHGGTLEMIWKNPKYGVFKEEIIRPEGIDTSYTIFKTLKSFNTFAELRQALGLV